MERGNYVGACEYKDFKSYQSYHYDCQWYHIDTVTNGEVDATSNLEETIINGEWPFPWNREHVQVYQPEKLEEAEDDPAEEPSLESKKCF